MAEKPRQKKFTRRSRTGCRTCRARHVKCDETPVACNNCTSAGWKCDGYDANRAKLTAHGRDSQICVKLPSPYSNIVSKPQLGSSLDEWRAFAFFQASTVPKMAGFFDSCLWNKLVLPMCFAEPAVSHAVVALSTMHEDLEVHGTPLPREDLNNNRHRFAMEQYGQALSALSRRRYVHDPNLRDVVLTCCLLFVVFELLRGRYDPALLHLEKGLSIIRDPGWNHDDDQHADGSLSEAMSRLDVQAVFFGVKEHYFDPTSVSETFTGDSLPNFRNLEEARREFDYVSNRIFRFVRYVASLMSKGSPLEILVERLGEHQIELKDELAKYSQRLNKSKRLLLRPGGPREQRAFDLICLHYLSLSVLLDTYLDEEEILNSDAHVNACEDLLVLSEKVMNSVKAESGSDWKSLPSLSLDTGIIPSLFYVCSKCPCGPMRQRALNLLESWPHREGLWDSNLVAIMARQLVAIEAEEEAQRLSIEGAAPTSYSMASISTDSRVQYAFMHVADDQTHAVITYTTKEAEKEGTKKTRLVMLNDHV
ncbi:hypothetical protein PISL3812_05211 [Talaromyces islandicus]|uniref:Zn(2)-C6 fungal-type domain-containing protein n=1 Tax=Talaromyces islandicus TaxID=28573 RepID=A0A0U1LXU3_TALIS|nr:hypothetical protein PISL3812_05211 [Talaromyces islandicus]